MAVSEILVYLELLRVQFSSEEEQVKADVRAVSESSRFAHNIALFAASLVLASLICIVTLPTGVNLNFRLVVLIFGLAVVLVLLLVWFDQQESTAAEEIDACRERLATHRRTHQAILQYLLAELLH